MNGFVGGFPPPACRDCDAPLDNGEDAFCADCMPADPPPQAAQDRHPGPAASQAPIHHQSADPDACNA